MRFYFRLTNGEAYEDYEGVDLPDVAAAEHEGAKVAGEWVRDNPDTFLKDGILKVEILDAERLLVASIDVAIVRAGLRLVSSHEH
jgi:hypothetical protein